MSDAGKLGSTTSDGLAALYGRYSGWLKRRLGRSVGAEDAADVVQETYLRIAPFAAGEIKHPKALLLRIATNLIRDEARRQRRTGPMLSSDDRQEAADQLDRLVLKNVILSMPTLYRDVFVLARFEGMTYPEIAKLKGISEQAVRWRMSRAMEHCLAQLDG